MNHSTRAKGRFHRSTRCPQARFHPIDKNDDRSIARARATTHSRTNPRTNPRVCICVCMNKQCVHVNIRVEIGFRPTGWRDRPRVRRHTITLGDDDDDDARQQNHGDGDGVVVPTPTPRDDGAPRDARRRSRRRNIHERCVSKRSRNERDDAREMRASRARART